jgi:hypothetical protein
MSNDSHFSDTLHLKFGAMSFDFAAVRISCAIVTFCKTEMRNDAFDGADPKRFNGRDAREGRIAS